MGLKGNLSTVNLADVFQMLSKGNSTGLLRIQAPEGSRFVEIQNGAISIAGRSTGRIMLGDLLVSRGLIDESQLAAALKEQKETGKLLGMSLVDSGLVSIDALEAALRFQIEEEVCELFHLKRGEFDFLNAVTLDANIAPGGGMIRFKLDPNGLLLEAARQSDEWSKVSDRIPSQFCVFKITEEGRKLIDSNEGMSPEGLIIMRLVQGNRTVENMVVKACLGRVATNQMLVELWDANLIVPAEISEYPAIAKEHLALNRAEEARRIATYAVETGTDEVKQKAREVIKEVEKMGTASTSGLNTGVPSKRHTEVVKRQAPANLLLKKQMPVWPFVAAGILIVGGAGAWFALSGGKTDNYTASRKSLDEVLDKVRDDMSAGKYMEALQRIKEFRSSEPEVQKIAREQYEQRQKDIETQLLRAIKGFDDARTANNAATVKTAAEELARFVDMDVSSPQVDAQRIRAHALLDNYHKQQRIGELQAHLQIIEAEERPKGKEALIKAYEGVVAEDPPEEIAGPVREQISELKRILREGKRLMARGEALENARFFQNAKSRFERVKTQCAGSELVVDADKKLVELSRAESAAQSRLDKIDVMLTQKNAGQAVTAIREFFDSKPPQELIPRANNMLQTVTNDPELLKNIDAAGRKNLEELSDQYASPTTVKLNIVTSTGGADVNLGFRPVGKTPLAIDLPSKREVCLQVKKDGYQEIDVFDDCKSSKTLSVLMESAPAVRARMPRKGTGGLAVIGEGILLAAGDELILCARQDLKVLKRFRIDVGPDRKLSFVPGTLSSSQGQAVAATQENLLVFFALASGELKKIKTEQPIITPPILINSSAGKDLVAVVTKQGFECYDFKTMANYRRINLSGDDQSAGALLDGDVIYVPKGGSVHSISIESGAKKWSVDIGAPICTTSSLNAKSILAIDTSGKAWVLEKENGSRRLMRELGSAPQPDVSNIGSGLLVAMKDGSVMVLKPDDGTPVWSIKLPGSPNLPLLAARNVENDTVKAIAVSVSSGSDYYVYVLNVETGATIWRAQLDSKPLSIASEGKRIYVATEDSDISAFEIN